MALKPENRKFGRIGVLMGGPSSEREISLKSGRAVYEALLKLDLKTIPVDIKTDSIKENIRLLKAKKIDCAFLALHGSFGEDGSIQNILEKIDIPYTGSGVRASRLAMDKVVSREIFKKNGLEVPKYKVINKFSYNKKEWRGPRMDFPLVVKPVCGGSSIGLSLVNNRPDLKKAADLAFSLDNRIIIEEYIKGRELTVGILNEKALPVIEIATKNIFFDYEAKYKKGFTDYIVPAELKEGIIKKVKGAALAAHRLLGCFGCSRVDIIMEDDLSPVVLEVNSIPGFTDTSLLPKAAKSAGIEFNQLCLTLIELAYDRPKSKEKK